jgi:choline dehydrogenase-like flavoprotein
MNYMRGSKADYDNWEALGNSGWGWQNLFPYFRKSTTFFPPSPQTVTKFNVTWDPTAYDHGPLSVDIDDVLYPDLLSVWSAWRVNRPDVPTPLDPSAGSSPGVVWQANTVDPRDGTRSTARRKYYDPICAKRKNLVILTGQTGREILFRGLRATGVEIVSRGDGSVNQVFARKEGTYSTRCISP